jgi:FlaA1/EpsC-like NDP-sugar epimerase
MFDLSVFLGRDREMTAADVAANEKKLTGEVENSRFLVIGGAGSIGQAVTKEIFRRQPKKLHVVDLSENNLVELVRDIRSSLAYIDGDFRTFAIDCGSYQYDRYFAAESGFDYILNLSALKHVRSEKDPFTLMRMIEVNILNTVKTIKLASAAGVKKYFCVSTDKAANPVNMMGASKRIMEMFLGTMTDQINISTARFANVAFSDGSLLYSFKERVTKMQPITAPEDIKRYFVSFGEAGQLCLLSTILGKNGDIFFPKLTKGFDLISFRSIAEKYLQSIGYQPYCCSSEDEAREMVHSLPKEKKWPCYFFDSDTTGEKAVEEFFTAEEKVNLRRFISVGVIEDSLRGDTRLLKNFAKKIDEYRKTGWTRDDLVRLFHVMIENFGHIEKGKFLDERM